MPRILYEATIGLSMIGTGYGVNRDCNKFLALCLMEAGIGVQRHSFPSAVGLLSICLRCPIILRIGQIHQLWEIRSQEEPISD